MNVQRANGEHIAIVEYEGELIRTYRAAAVLMIVQGGIMELGAFIALIPLLAAGIDQADVGEHVTFIVPYLQENLYLMMAMSGIFGVIRIIGAVGVLRNRMWGWVLSVITCSVTMALMIFMLPAGIIDGLLSGTALVLLLTQYFGSRALVNA